MKAKLFLLSFSLFSFSLFAQDDLLDLVEETDPKEETIYTTATFKGTKIINMQSCEIPGAGVMQFIIMHRFGALNDDFMYNFFGLEQASTRFSFDYSINDWLNVGIGRSSMSKTYDGFFKAKLLRQSSGGKNMPISMVAYASMNYNTTRYIDNLPHYTTDRLSYSYQLVVARKFNEWFSFEVTPTLIHYNLVETTTQNNDVFALGFGGRIKLSQRIAITGEYMLQMPNHTYLDPATNTEVNFNNSASLGVDIETGGHVFQLHITNSRGMADPEWVGRTPGNWFDGDVYLGFNISRVFTIKKPKRAEEPQW